MKNRCVRFLLKTTSSFLLRTISTFQLVMFVSPQNFLSVTSVLVPKQDKYSIDTATCLVKQQRLLLLYGCRILLTLWLLHIKISVFKVSFGDTTIAFDPIA